MVYGRTGTELLQLNEDSVWYGGPQDRLPKDALQNLPELRRLIRAGRQKEAEALVRSAFVAYPSSQRHYEPLGSLYLEFNHDENKISNYKRELDIEDAVSRVEYSYDGCQYRREVLASYPDQVIAIKVTSSRRSTFIVRLGRVSEHEYETNEFLDSLSARDGKIIMHATPGGRNSNRLCCIASASTDKPEGTIRAVGNTLAVTGTSALIVLAAQTTFRVDDPEIAALQDIQRSGSWDGILQRHRADYSALYRRVSLELFPDYRSDAVPTDVHLEGPANPGLIAQYYNYGRYLLISSSRDDYQALPATLQGIWNPSFQPAWGSKYTININLQMNYWPANTSNLPECETPLFELIERMAKNGERTAREMYGCRGWCAHHNTDIYADTDPQDKWMSATLWPLGGAWLCTHIWERYLFFGDVEFLKRLFPTLEGCVRFLLDYLIEDETGTFLVTNPSLSPENTFKNARNEEGVFCEASTMDIQIITAVFNAYISTTKLLPRSPVSVSLQEVQHTCDRLPPMEISPEGLIQEWGRNDYDEVEPGHRHISHLWGLHPCDLITPTSTPSLAKAASAVLSRRAAHGSGHTGWSSAWLINFHARLGEPEKCKEHVERLLRDSTLSNMLDNHPPFQIDGNFGGAAGILEMIVQSHEVDREKDRRIIRLLPAWPKEWKGGEVRGVRVRGGGSVSFKWENGKVIGEFRIICELYTNYRLIFPDGGGSDFRGDWTHVFPQGGA
ncbi:Alpha-L-fucosidase [Drechslerella dactyloides]|uniref:Alpha-L-fucosidase n=1 Tax=Drechslerella dactyloides TaxID=74499 RepID=A0AAD6NNF5_DREDA|nr:Alpha-L-fucosidase [Drechslerella dactyloides]